MPAISDCFYVCSEFWKLNVLSKNLTSCTKFIVDFTEDHFPVLITRIIFLFAVIDLCVPFLVLQFSK